MQLADPLFAATEFSFFPLRSVGVQGDNRTYAMTTAIFPPQPAHTMSKEYWKALFEAAVNIPNSVCEVNRVVVCLSHTSDQLMGKNYIRNKLPFHLRVADLVEPGRVDRLRMADHHVTQLVHEMNLYEKIWQFPVVMIPIGFIEGSEGIVLRPVESSGLFSIMACLLHSLNLIPYFHHQRGHDSGTISPSGKIPCSCQRSVPFFLSDFLFDIFSFSRFSKEN